MSRLHTFVCALVACGACTGTLHMGDRDAPDGAPSAPVHDGGTRDAGQGSADGTPGDPAEDAGGAVDAGEPDAGFPVADPGTDGDGNSVIGPEYGDADEVQTHDVPHGRVFGFQLSSEGSAYYDGFDPTLKDENQHTFSRHVDVYVPAQYVDGTFAPLLVVHDGPNYTDVVSTTLDNLIAAGKLPKIVALFVNHGGGDSIGSERGLEYDTMSDKYARFLEDEVIPAALANDEVAAAYPHLALERHPEARAAMGCSSGGAAALTMGWFRPDLYRRIITYSGTFVDQQNPEAPSEADYPKGAWEYHDRLIEDEPVKPLRIFLQVAQHDLGEENDEASLHNWIMANQRTADDLAARGYHYRFVYANGAYHCDGRVLRQTLPETLLWTFRGLPLD